MNRSAILLLCFFGLCARTSPADAAMKKIRVGYFPNITHAQAIVGLHRGTFQQAVGNDIAIETKIFNAGPSVIEALFAGSIDLAYIGPNPAVNGYVKSNGEALRIVCGATSGGAGLVVRKDAGIKTPADLHNKRIASPQLGNTQDVALRTWLAQNKLLPREKGGEVQVIPVSNPDQLTLFLKKELDAAWTVEPWVSRLEAEGNGELFLDERSLWPQGKFATALIIVSTRFLKEQRQLVKQWLQAHCETTAWIRQNPSESARIINSALKELTTKSLPEPVLLSALSRLEFTDELLADSVRESARAAFNQGFLGKRMPDLSGLFDASVLEEIGVTHNGH